MEVHYIDKRKTSRARVVDTVSIGALLKRIALRNHHAVSLIESSPMA